MQLHFVPSFLGKLENLAVLGPYSGMAVVGLSGEAVAFLDEAVLSRSPESLPLPMF